jgi:hypothetical protein
MTRVCVRWLIVVSLVFVAGCSSSNKGKIEGTRWCSIPGTIRGQHFKEGALKLEFAADGKMDYRTPRGTFSGTYSLGPGTTVVFNLDRELAGMKNHAEQIKIGGDWMKVTDPDGTEMTFRKQ